MNDTINMTWLRLQSKLSVINPVLSSEIINDIKSLVELEQKAVKNLQLLEIDAYHLISGDIIFDMYKKTLHKVKYCEYRSNCQFNIEKEHKEILVDYGNDEPCDYFEENSKLYILVDLAEVASIHNRPKPEWEDEDY